MTEQLRCKRCGFTMPVDEEDPDGSVDDIVEHVGAHHGLDRDLAIRWEIEIEPASEVEFCARERKSNG